METEDDFYNANELSEDESGNEFMDDQYDKYSERKKIQEQSQIEQEEEQKNTQDSKLPDELKEFQDNFRNEVNKKSQTDKELRGGGYFDFIFHLCKQLTYKYLIWDYEFRSSVILEIETFILLFQSREDPNDQALDPTIINLNNLKNQALKNPGNIDLKELSSGVLVLDRIIHLLQRARQCQNDVQDLKKTKDISEKSVQASLKEIESTVNHLFRSTKEDKLDKCAKAMEELDKLRISPYWEESAYRYRLLYKELLWIKQEFYSTSSEEDQNLTFDKVAEACDVTITTEALLISDPIIPGLKIVDQGIVNGGYFERRINEIFAVVELQSKLDSEATIYRGLCTILKCIRKLFNYDLQKKTFIWCIDQLHKLVNKKCEEYFGKITTNKTDEDQELSKAFEWLQKISFLLDEIRACKNNPQKIMKGDVQYESKNLNIEAEERIMFEAWHKYWSAKWTLNDLVQQDYQKIFQDLEKNIEDMIEECIDTKSTEMLERAMNVKEVCEELIFKIQEEEKQIDWKTFRKRQFAKKGTKNDRYGRRR